MPPLTHRLVLPSLLALLMTGCSGENTEQPDKAAKTQADQAATAETTSTEVISQNPQDSIAISVRDISVQTWQGQQAAAITLSTAVALNQPLEQWLAIETLAGDDLKGGWVADKRGKTLYFSGLQPEAQYRVRVKTGLPAANGSTLNSDSSLTLETPAMTSALGFASRGNLLAHRLREGLPVMAVNVEQVDLDVYRIREQELVSFFSGFGHQTQLSSWDAEQLLEQTELVWSGRFDLELDANTRATRYLPVQKVDPLKEAGVYLAVMRQAGNISYSYPATWFSVTDLGAQVRLYADRLDVQVNSLASVDPVKGVELRLFNNKGEVMGTARTDAEGRAGLDQSSLTAELAEARLLLLQQKGQVSLVRLTGPALDLAEFPVTGPDRQPQEVFIYSPRDIYRPGETLVFSALLRSQQGEAVPGITLESRLVQPDGRVVSSQRLEPQALNYYEVSLPLSADAATGEWRFQMILPDGTQREYPVHIETFLPERLALNLDSPDFLKPSDTFQVQVQGDYLYGAPASGNRLQSQLIARLEPHPYESFADFWFGHPDHTELERREDLEEVQLDEAGRAQVQVDSYWQELTSPLRLQTYASLLDSGGRPVSRRISSVVMPNAERLPGIRPLFADAQVDYEGQASFELILTDGTQKLAADSLQVNLVRERRDYHWSWNDADGWLSHYTERHYSVDQREIAITAGNSVQLNLPVEWGYYRLEVKDPETGLTSAFRFRAGWDPDSQVMAGRPDRIGLTLNQQSYAPGDELRVQVRPPAAGKGYLMLETDRLLHREPVDIPADGAELSVKLKPEWLQQNLYLSVVLLQPGDARERTLPKRMLGLQPVPVSPESHALELAFEGLPQELRPEQTIDVPVQVTRADGQPLDEQVYLTLAAVDVGVLAITDFQTPDPLDWFYTPGAYAIELRDNYNDLIDAEAGAMAHLRYGGDADLSRGGAQPPTDVQILSLFSGALAVDEQGRASIPLDLPAFNGRMRLMALAFSDNALGSVDHEVPVVAPVVAELNRPRFLSPGDSSQLTLDLHNRTEQAQTLDVSLMAGKGLVFDKDVSSWQKAVELDAGQRITEVLPVHAKLPAGAIPIRLSVTGIEGEADLQREWTLGVRPAWPAQSLSWQQPLQPGADFSLSGQALEGLLPDTLNAQLSLSARPPFNLARHFSELRAYPYGCAEQTTSGVFPHLYLGGDSLAALGIKGEDRVAQREAVELAIRRLFSMQLGNGSFGLWSDNSPEEPWLTVYITDFLLRAREAGYTVSEPALKHALEQVGRYLRHPNSINGELLHDQRSRFAVRAYAAQVLARSGQAPLAELRNLIDHHANSAPPLAMLQLGLALRAAGDGQRADKAFDQALPALARGEFNHTDYGSEVRDLALALFWLLEAGAEEVRWLPLLDRLQPAVAERRWFSTQERNALFLAGQALAGTEAPDVKLALSGAWEQVLTGDSSRSLSLAGEALLQGVQIENQGADRAWLNLRLQGYTDQPPAAISHGIKVERHYYDANGKPLDIRQLKTGDQVLVELRVESDEAVNDALVVDLLPAGLEVENQNLASSFELSELNVGGERVTELMSMLDIRHQEFRDDRYVAAVNLHYRGARLFYLARAVTPGSYRIPPTYAESMYRPETRHQGGEKGWLRVKAR